MRRQRLALALWTVRHQSASQSHRRPLPLQPPSGCFLQTSLLSGDSRSRATFLPEHLAGRMSSLGRNTQRRTAPFECGCTGILRFRDLPPYLRSTQFAARASLYENRSACRVANVAFATSNPCLLRSSNSSPLSRRRVVLKRSARATSASPEMCARGSLSPHSAVDRVDRVATSHIHARFWESLELGDHRPGPQPSRLLRCHVHQTKSPSPWDERSLDPPNVQRQRRRMRRSPPGSRSRRGTRRRGLNRASTPKLSYTPPSHSEYRFAGVELDTGCPFS